MQRTADGQRVAPSANKDRFNHDDDAAGYDRDVSNESHPIRAGYDELLTWVASQIARDKQVVDLGCGTGNLAARLEMPARIIGVDVAEKMISIARSKLDDKPVEFILADLLECFEQLPVVDAIVSTYAVHHLTGDEKRLLFQLVRDHLCDGGTAAFGDLMFESRQAGDEICAEFLANGQAQLVDDIRDEFFWHLDEATDQLRNLGFAVTTKRFSQLSWGVLAEKPATAGNP